ncbi:MAG: hypothetical protein GY822_12315 [Deltaproteobacteria bacterium]|nr:hypothetical protein [Deltaproteobacteria bacterium]
MQSPTLPLLIALMSFISVRKADGKAVSVLGRFDLSLDRNGFQKKGRIEQALKRFVEESREDFGLLEGESVKFRVQETVILNDETFVVHFDQMVGGLRVIDQPLSAVFSSDGALIALNGAIISDHASNGRSSMARPSMADIDVQSALDEHCGHEHASFFDEHDRDFHIVGENLYRRNDNAELEAGWSMQIQGVVWQARLPDKEFVIDDASGLVILGGSNENELTTTCNVRTRPLPTATGGRVSSIRPATGTVNTNLTCRGFVSNFFTNTCTWELRREEGISVHDVDHVLDGNGGETTDVQSCASTSAPNFWDIREEVAFHTESQMRLFIQQNVWDNNSAVRSANVQIETDNTTTATARFSPFCATTGVCPELICNPNAAAGVDGACSSDVLAHEFGHYVHWSLGHQGDQTCKSGVNEGGSLNETLANSFAMLVWLDDPRSSNMEYNAANGAIGGNIPPPHTNSFSGGKGGFGGFVFSDGSENTTGANPASCNGGNNGNGFGDPIPGLHFNQVLWEVMFNRDCSWQWCPTNAGFAQGAGIFLNENQEQVLNRVGDALGWAVKSTSSFVSHQTIIDMFIIRLHSNSGLGVAQRAGDVFEHHGFTSPL